MSDVKLKENNKKDYTITIRCSKKEKELMELKAKKLGVSTSQYLLDSGIAGTERHRSKDRKRIRRMVEYDQLLNSLFSSLKETNPNCIPETVKTEIDKVLMKGAEIWRC